MNEGFSMIIYFFLSYIIGNAWNVCRSCALSEPCNYHVFFVHCNIGGVDHVRRPLPQVGGAGALVAAALLGPRLGR